MDAAAGGRVVVVGAGITGLSAAHRLVVDRPDLEVTLLEAAPRVGGKLVTTPLAGLPVDEGADSILVQVPWATQLCAELGLADEMVAPAARSASIWLDGRLRPIPAGNVLGLPLDPSRVQPGLLPQADLDRLAGPGLPDEPLAPGEGPVGDLSVAEVVRSCAGQAVLDRLVDPLLGGINAGRTEDLSCAAMAPYLLQAARSPDGLLATLRSAFSRSDPTAAVFNAHPGGMVRLVEALADRLDGRIRTDSRVLSIARSGSHWTIDHDGGSEQAAAVVVTTPAFAAAPLVEPVSPTAAGVLAAVEHASVALTVLAYRRSDLEVPTDQTGFLVPRGTGMLMTACSFSGSKWSHLDDGEHTILRVSAGRIDDDRIAHLDDAALVAALQRDVAATLGAAADPVEVRVTRWPDSLAQFPVGHTGLMAGLAETLAGEAPGLFVTGSAHNGVGIPACVRSGNDAAAAVSAFLG